MALPNEVAAALHKRMVLDSRFGYSWEERWGNPDNSEWWQVFDRSVEIKVGDYDCSSSVITVWRLALKGTGYEGPLYDATYTGNMRSAFLATGLFEVWDTDSTEAQLGDVYLNDGNHTALCQLGEDGDMLSEFNWGDNGAYGNERGDPTVFYQTHNLGGDWNDVMQGTKDTGGSSDDFAGEYGVAQDAIRIWRESGTQPRYNVFS